MFRRHRFLRRRINWAEIALTALALAGAFILISPAVHADACERYAQHRDTYLDRAAAGMDVAIDQMASQRGVTRDVAAFYWGGDLMRQADPVSLRSLSQLTLATYTWPGHAERAESAMERIFIEHEADFAGLLAGLMLSDDHGQPDTYRARAHLRDAADQGNLDAAAFLRLFNACNSRSIAFN